MIINKKALFLFALLAFGQVFPVPARVFLNELQSFFDYGICKGEMKGPRFLEFYNEFFNDEFRKQLQMASVPIKPNRKIKTDVLRKDEYFYCFSISSREVSVAEKLFSRQSKIGRQVIFKQSEYVLMLVLVALITKIEGWHSFIDMDGKLRSELVKALENHFASLIDVCIDDLENIGSKPENTQLLLMWVSYCDLMLLLHKRQIVLPFVLLEWAGEQRLKNGIEPEYSPSPSIRSYIPPAERPCDSSIASSSQSVDKKPVPRRGCVPGSVGGQRKRSGSGIVRSPEPSPKKPFIGR